MNPHRATRRVRRRRSVPLVALAVLLALATAAPAATLTGTDLDDVLRGTPGADTLSGGAGNDRLSGDRGDDILAGGSGNDDLSGGPRADAVVYSDAASVRVTLDDLANDGPPGEQDNVQIDIETVYGSRGADRLSGNDADNVLDGGDGDDVIDGSGGDDQIFGAAGADRLLARDGRLDRVDCGEGEDIAILDTRDVARGCEIVDRRPVAARVDANLRWTAAFGPSTVYSELRVLDVRPATASLTLVCSGGGCPFERRALRSRRDAVPPLEQARLRPGSRLELGLTAKGRVSKVIRLSTRRSTPPTRQDLCGTRLSKPMRCPR
jgi:hypothetical protein